jgi:hypothetical protein
MYLTEEQFQALKRWIQHEAYVAAGSATHQTRCEDTMPEWNARIALLNDYGNVPSE